MKKDHKKIHCLAAAAVLALLSLISSCSLFETKEASLSIEDRGKFDDRYQYFIDIRYDDGETQEMMKLGSEAKEKIILGVDEFRGAEITVNKIDSAKQTIVATGSAETDQIIGEMTVRMRPVGRTSIDLKMTAGHDTEASAFSARNGRGSGEAVFDAVYASSGELDAKEEYIEIYKGEPKHELMNELRTIPIKAGKETAADITYYLMFQGKEIDRIVIKGSDYIKNETVKHSVISETLLSYDIRPSAEQNTETWATVDIGWDVDPELEDDIDRAVFSYMGKEWKIPYEKGEFSIDIDDRHPDMTISYFLTYKKDRSVTSPVRTVNVERDNRLRAVEIHYGQVKPGGETTAYTVKRIPDDAPLAGNEELICWNNDLMQVIPSMTTEGKQDFHHGVFQGWNPGSAEIEYVSGDFRYSTKISIISIPKLSFSADERDLTFRFEPYGDPNVEITLWRKTGSIFNMWIKIPSEDDISSEGTFHYREGSRRFPVWFKAEYRQKNGEGLPIESNWVSVERESVLPPPPEIDTSIDIQLPIPDSDPLMLTRTDNKDGSVTFTMKSNQAVREDNIFWSLNTVGARFEGKTFTFIPADYRDSITDINTEYDESNGRTYLLEQLTLFAHDREGKLFSAETELKIDVTDII